MKTLVFTFIIAASFVGFGQLHQICCTQGLNHHHPMAMSNQQFSLVEDEFQNAAFDDKRIELIDRIIRINSLSAAQAGELLSTFSFDQSRLEGSKLLFIRIIDKENYWQAAREFTFMGTKRAFETFLDQQLAMENQPTCQTHHSICYSCHTHPVSHYSMNAASFNQLLNEVRDETMDSQKVRRIQTILKGKKLSTAQAIQLLETFTFDSQRLEAGLWMKDHLVDPQNYWTASKTFEFQSYKTKFEEGI